MERPTSSWQYKTESYPTPYFQKHPSYFIGAPLLMFCFHSATSLCPSFTMSQTLRYVESSCESPSWQQTLIWFSEDYCVLIAVSCRYFHQSSEGSTLTPCRFYPPLLPYISPQFVFPYYRKSTSRDRDAWERSITRDVGLIEVGRIGLGYIFLFGLNVMHG